MAPSVAARLYTCEAAYDQRGRRFTSAQRHHPGQQKPQAQRSWGSPGNVEKVLVRETLPLVWYVTDSMRGGFPEADVERRKAHPGPGLRGNWVSSYVGFSSCF